MSTYIQQSFLGGMNLLADDTRIGGNQYRVGFNLRNRYDVLEPTLQSELDIVVNSAAAANPENLLPYGTIQEKVTFGEYIVLFASGLAYFRHYTASSWQQIPGFRMSDTAPRFWTVAVPVSTTNYGRKSVDDGSSNVQPNGGIILTDAVSTTGGNEAGLLVQDNVSQPQFIYIKNGYPTTRVTQTYDDWSETVVSGVDHREYVPVGNSMAYVDGVLYIASPDGNYIYRSVSGRPLDFVINVDLNGAKGGNAATTSYSVGIGGIRCLREASGGGLFVAAGNTNFIVIKNMTEGSPKIFGEYTFIRQFLFNATCLSDRTIIDSLGDTKFIDLSGIRSFNAIQQLQSEGRNSAFSANIQTVFSGITQDSELTAAILYDNYELYAVRTIFGNVIAIYDTINGCWSSFDNSQTDGKAVKIFSKIELDVQRLYAVTEDNKLYTLYIGPDNDTPTLRPISVSATLLAQTDNAAQPKGEIKLTEVRAVLNEIDDDVSMSVTPYVNNRLTAAGTFTKSIEYAEPTYPANSQLPDVDTQLSNVLFSMPNCSQGWKTFCEFTWTGGTLVQFSFTFNDLAPMNPLNSQS